MQPLGLFDPLADLLETCHAVDQILSLVDFLHFGMQVLGSAFGQFDNGIDASLFQQRFATVGGGAGNVAGDIDATVSGGTGNVASFHFATVGGGTQNLANSTAAIVSGGDHNLAQGAYSSVLGGLNNNAEGYMAAIGGGAGNTASGDHAVVPGRFANTAAGDYSFAAGTKAEVNAEHPGIFLFADSSLLPFPSLAPNEFAVRATGGVRLVTAIDNSGAPLAGVRLSAGSGAWESLSDVNLKFGFAPVDENQILQSLMMLPVRSWYYRGQDASMQHIGPTAQDFHAAFNLGEDNHYISTVDADGVALASIQELYRMIRTSQQAAPQQRIDALEQRLAYTNAFAAVSMIIAAASLWNQSAHAGGK